MRESSINYKAFPDQCPDCLEQVLGLNFFPSEAFDKENGIF
ncbi:DUF29 domain-containing protein [[Phormidium] sp. LEGE 05292]|nr:DUF29 domain-containing protein [Phormidium sp. LEGE 05292]